MRETKPLPCQYLVSFCSTKCRGNFIISVHNVS